MSEQERDQYLEEAEEEVIVDDESIYSVEVRDQLIEDDELSAAEDGFMQGYDDAYGELGE